MSRDGLKPWIPAVPRDPIPATLANLWIAWDTNGRIAGTGVWRVDAERIARRAGATVESYEFLPEKEASQ